MTPVERQKVLLDRTAMFEKAVMTTDIHCGETQQFAFVYKGNPEDIEGYKVHCKTCTKVAKEGNILRATFTAPGCGDYYENKQKGETEQHYTSHISVYFKDGQPLQIFTPAGEIKDNPDKVAVSLQIRTRILF